MVNVDEIRTERLLMRRWQRRDRAPFAALNADPEVMRHFPAVIDRVASDAAVDRYEESFENNGFGLWALERLEDGRLLGFTGLNAMPEGVTGEGDQEIGWRLARHAWHQGYATEAARAVVDVAFGPLRLPRLWSMTAVSNTSSRAVMQRIGMAEHGFFEHPRVPRGHPVRPHVLYRLDAPDRPPVRA
jgi:RimJ/RimL family protein N-acetyltransferase